MIRSVLSDLGGVGVYGLISMLIFFAVFAGVLMWVVSLKKPYLEEMKEMPLGGDRVVPREGGDLDERA